MSRFPTKLYENRFIVGHIVECIIADNSGCTVTKNTKRTDITDGQNNYSVKYSSSGNIKLYNTLGECKDVDICPTFLIFPDRITYIDKDILNRVHGDYNVCLKNNKDGCSLTRKSVNVCVTKIPEISFPIKLTKGNFPPIDISRYILNNIICKDVARKNKNEIKEANV